MNSEPEDDMFEYSDVSKIAKLGNNMEIKISKPVVPGMKLTIQSQFGSESVILNKDQINKLHEEMLDFFCNYCE